MHPRDIRVSTAVNTLCINKTRKPGEEKGWRNISVPLGDLLDEIIFKGHAFSTSLFRGNRCAENAFGGNLIVIDEDDGLEPEFIASLPVFQEWGIAIFPSCSSRVVAQKADVDGRYRSRVLFRVAEQFNTGTVVESFQRERKSIHLERNAVTTAVYQRFREEAGLEKLQDSCGKTIAQLMYGNDGVTPIEIKEKQPDNTKKVVETYPCSTETYCILNDGCITKEQKQQIIEAYRIEQGENLKPKAKVSEAEAADQYQKALWMLENDVFSEQTLVTYETWYPLGMACKGIDPDLMEPFLTTTSRFSDQKARLSWSSMEDNWHRFSDESSYGIGTLIHQADIDTNRQWRDACPFFGSKQVKQKLSSVYHLLKSHSPETPGLNNHPNMDY